MAYLTQVWIRCDHPDCDRMHDLMVKLHQVSRPDRLTSTALPPGWSHVKRGAGAASAVKSICYISEAFCPDHGDPCIHGSPKMVTVPDASDASDASVARVDAETSQKLRAFLHAIARFGDSHVEDFEVELRYCPPQAREVVLRSWVPKRDEAQLETLLRLIIEHAQDHADEESVQEVLDGTEFLRDDFSWQPVAGASGAMWSHNRYKVVAGIHRFAFSMRASNSADKHSGGPMHDGAR